MISDPSGKCIGYLMHKRALTLREHVAWVYPGPCAKVCSVCLDSRWNQLDLSLLSPDSVCGTALLTTPLALPLLAERLAGQVIEGVDRKPESQKQHQHNLALSLQYLHAAGANKFCAEYQVRPETARLATPADHPSCLCVLARAARASCEAE